MVALSLVGNGERNVALAARRVATEHRLNMGRVHVDVRHHHDHIPGPQCRIGIERSQQLVVQNFHFPLGAVGVVEHHGMVAGQIHRALLLADFLQRRQVVDIVLQLVQQAGVIHIAMVGEDVDLLARRLETGAVVVRVVELIQQANVVPALFSPGRQQRVGVLVQLVRVVNLRQHRVCCAPLAFGF